MPQMNGIEAAKLIKQQSPTTGIVALTMYEDAGTMRDMLATGVNAYLLKNAEIEEIVTAVHAAYNGRFYVSAATAQHLHSIIGFDSEKCTFTQRELEILQLLWEEQTSREIAQKLFISERTVEDHRKHLQKKTGSKNIVGLLKYALKNKTLRL